MILSFLKTNFAIGGYKPLKRVDILNDKRTLKIQDNIASEFDEFSKDYTSDMQKCVPHYNFLLSCFSNTYPKNFKPTTILDQGCGNGNVTQQLIKLFPKAQYILLDASHEMLTLCKKRFKKYAIETVESYFNAYEFPKNHFDLIVSGFSIHHCNQKEKQQIFKRIYQSLKPNGIYASSDLMINKNATEHKHLLAYWQHFVLSNYTDENKWNWLMEHYNEFDKPDNITDQLNWLKEVGFKNFEISIKDKYWTHFKAQK